MRIKIMLVILLFIAILSVVGIKNIFTDPKAEGKTPEQVLQEKYKDTAAYTILKSVQEGEYFAYLGKDNEKISLNIFRGEEYFGEKPMLFERMNVLNSIDYYYFMQDETLIVVFGENPDLMYKNYRMEISGNKISTKEITRNIEGESYILDVYVLDRKYNGTPNLVFEK